jgi:hypothetical protein
VHGGDLAVALHHVLDLDSCHQPSPARARGCITRLPPGRETLRQLAGGGASRSAAELALERLQALAVAVQRRVERRRRGRRSGRAPPRSAPASRSRRCGPCIASAPRVLEAARRRLVAVRRRSPSSRHHRLCDAAAISWASRNDRPSIAHRLSAAPSR